MKTGIAALIVTAGLAAFGVAPVEAQVVRGGAFGPRVFTGPGGPVGLTPGYAYPSAYSPSYVVSGANEAVKPYSYYVLPSSVPSRVYVGPTEFPYYGRPYGHPYDRWTWAYMGEPVYGGLPTYYYPPLGF